VIEWWDEKGYKFIDEQSQPPYRFRVSVNTEESHKILSILKIDISDCRFLY
jgi:hypothetical protein